MLNCSYLSPEWSVWIHKQDAIFFLREENHFLNVLFYYDKSIFCGQTNITWLTNDDGTPGGPWKKKIWFVQMIHHERDTQLKNIKVENLLEVQGVHVGQEIPDGEGQHAGWASV